MHSLRSSFKWIETTIQFSQRATIQYSSQSGTNLFTLHSATTEAERARLLSVSSEGASDWLHAIPIPSLSLHLDTMSLHIACGLHLGATLCHPHECNCGEMVEPNGRHGLKCKKAWGQKTRHEEVNQLIKPGLDQAWPWPSEISINIRTSRPFQKRR